MQGVEVNFIAVLNVSTIFFQVGVLLIFLSIIICDDKFRRSKVRINAILEGFNISVKSQLTDGLKKTPSVILKSLPNNNSHTRFDASIVNNEDDIELNKMADVKRMKVKHGFRTIVVKRKKTKKRIRKRKRLPAKRNHGTSANSLHLQLLNKRIRNPVFKSTYPRRNLLRK